MQVFYVKNIAPSISQFKNKKSHSSKWLFLFLIDKINLNSSFSSRYFKNEHNYVFLLNGLLLQSADKLFNKKSVFGTGDGNLAA